MPRLVGGPLLPAPGGEGERSTARPGALLFAPSARLLLTTVARHPFLTVDQLGGVTGWPTRQVRRRRDALVAARLLRHLDPDETRPSELGPGFAPSEVLELTHAGLTLVAAWLGLSLAQAIRHHGLAGGGPDCPTGGRAALRATLAHTLGCHAVMAAFHRALAGPRRAGGMEDGVVEWRSSRVLPAPCAGSEGRGGWCADERAGAAPSSARPSW